MTLKDYLKKAQRQKFAIGQFNFSTLEQLRGILAAAQKMKSPVILGTSEGETKHLGLKQIVALVEIEKMKYKVDVFLNLDHAKDLDIIKKAIDFGYSAVHFDGSHLPLEKNIKYAKKVVEYAYKRGVLVEGTFPGADSFTVDIGNIHGMHRDVKLNFEKLKEIRKNTNAFLVLHGGSGISKDQIKKAIELGIVKININTELRLAWKRSLLKSLKSQEIKPYKVLPQVQKAIQEKVEEKLKSFKK